VSTFRPTQADQATKLRTIIKYNKQQHPQRKAQDKNDFANNPTINQGLNGHYLKEKETKGKTEREVMDLNVHMILSVS
jgi:hypothetical protein